VNRAGITPTTVVGTPFSVSTRPTTFGSALKCLTHILCAMTTTGVAPGPASAGPITRPSAADTPRNWNVLGVTTPHASCSVPSVVVISMSSNVPPMTSSNTWFCST
jgi:hypothetical protein